MDDDHSSYSSSRDHAEDDEALAGSPNIDSMLPEAPDPMPAGFDHYAVPAPAATWHQIPFSRIGIGANISPLGIGINSSIVLNHYVDGRVIVDFFNYNTGRFEVEGVNVNATLHMLSAAVALDVYPLGSIFRISPGVLFYNGNQISGSGSIVGGNSFTLGGQTYYSANPNPATGATPLSGSGTLVLHGDHPAFTLTGGFGKYIPRSNRHWSFPFEIGAAFTGASNINLKAVGWICTDAQQTKCSNVNTPNDPIAIEFNAGLQKQLQKWRNELATVTVYPMISSSVVYSFNIPR